MFDETLQDFGGGNKIFAHAAGAIDGKDNIYDVCNYPADLISFPKVTDVDVMPKPFQEEYQKLLKIRKEYDKHSTEHDAPVNGIGLIEPLIKL